MTQIPQRRHTPEGLTLSPAMEDYLKAIFSLGKGGNAVSTQSLADRLNFSPASVTKMLKRLAGYKLVEYEKYQGVRLTESGRKVAVEILRHHRLLELYLTHALGYSWDEVHDEAELLEHFISEKLEARICEFLGNPDFDPHGAPIPTLDGELPGQSGASLLEVELFRPHEVVRVSDAESMTLQTLEALGIFPGVTVCVLGRPPHSSVHLRIGRSEQLVSPELCGRVTCDPSDNERFVLDQLREGESATITKIRAHHRRDVKALGLETGSSLSRQGKDVVGEQGKLAIPPEMALSLILKIEE
jgi:DtxR family transcriptional regulator, Mn-dependent transcriptional regulator